MITLKHFKIYCEVAVSSPVLHRAIKVSLIVGSALNLINQGEALLLLDLQTLCFTKLILTYIVPYGVTTYTATVMKLEFHIGTKASVEADLKCTKCAQEAHVQKNELIPECPLCGIKTKWELK